MIIVSIETSTRNQNPLVQVKSDTIKSPKNAGTHVISVRLNVFDPKTLPNAIHGFHFLMAITEVSTSGNDVPRATTDNVSTEEVIQRRVEISKTLSIRYFALNANVAILTIIIEPQVRRL